MSDAPEPLPVQIERLAEDGQGIATVDGREVHVRDAVPGDLVTLSAVRKRRKRRRESSIDELHTAGDDRATPRCAHTTDCGGCRLQHVAYEAQLRFKECELRNRLEPLFGQDQPEWRTILGCDNPFEYRNKLEFSFCDQRWLSQQDIDSDATFTRLPAAGFHPQGQFAKILHLDRCHLMPAVADSLRLQMYDYAIAHELPFYNVREKHGIMRNLIVRQTTRGETMAIASFGEDHPALAGLLDQLAATEGVTSVHKVINPKGNDSIYDPPLEHTHGEPSILEDLGGSVLCVRPKSFLQPNSRQARILYDVIAEFAKLEGHEKVLDLYSGIGSISLMIARQAGHVHGIEEVPDAVRDANENAARNEIENISFATAKVESVLADHTDNVDLVICDPPRAGIHPAAIRAMIQLAAPRIIYVSCNPKSLARDLQALSLHYRCVRVQPVDMFPHTLHLETVVELVKRELT